MKNGELAIQEQSAGNAFGKQAPVFDQLYGSDSIVQYKRKRVRDHVEQWIKPGSYMLELNAGTGEDAVYFAKQGHRIHATDISTGMLGILSGKIAEQGLPQRIWCASDFGIRTIGAVDAKNTVATRVKTIVTELVPDDEYDRQAGRHAERKPADVECGVKLLLQEVAPGDFYVVGQHIITRLNIEKRSRERPAGHV